MIFEKITKKRILISIILASVISISLPEILNKIRKTEFKASLTYETAVRKFDIDYNFAKYLTGYKLNIENLALNLNDQIYSRSKKNNCSNFGKITDKPRIIIQIDRGNLNMDLFANSTQSIKACIKFIDLFLKDYEEKEKKFIIRLLEYKNYLPREFNNENSQNENIEQKLENLKKKYDQFNFDEDSLNNNNAQLLLFSIIISDIIENTYSNNLSMNTTSFSREKIRNLVLIEKRSEKINQFKPVKRTILYPSLFVVVFCLTFILLNISILKEKIKKLNLN